MAKCTPCRIRHLPCDTNNLVCSECAKADRECVRGYNLRFRHLTCPSKTPDRKDFSKYEFFFDEGQTWVQKEGKGELEFICESESLSEDLSLEEVARNDALANGEREKRRAMTSYTPKDRSSTRTCDAPALINELPHVEHPQPLPENFNKSSPEALAPASNSPDYADDNQPFSQTPLSKLDILANQSLAEVSLTGETLYALSKTSYPHTPASTADFSWPLKNLREGRLLQHYITHLSPWVCSKETPGLRLVADRVPSSM